MNHKQKSFLKYFLKSRHRCGHGIHSPFLFHLITTVIENHQKIPEYQILKNLRKQALKMLAQREFQELIGSDPSFLRFSTKPNEIYRKIELRNKFGEMMLRLIREFQPSSVIYYGPGLGVNLAALALANNRIPVYCVAGNELYGQFVSALLVDLKISNLFTFNENNIPIRVHSFSIINYPDNPEKSKELIQAILANHGDDDILIINGIHQSVGMERVWNELVAKRKVRVTLDHFETGLVLFRKNLQKESFIHRF